MSDDLPRRVAARYGAAGWWTRFHVRGRVASCPFRPVLDALPAEGLVASLGCGHGAFEIGMALEGGRRSIVGADIDDRKLPHARRAAEGLAVRFHHGDLFELLSREALRPAAIVVMDVFYLIPRDIQDELLSRSFGALAPGGVLLVKEMDLRPRWKWWWNRVQEFLACRVLRITRNEGGVVGLRGADEWCSALRLAGFAAVTATPVHRGYPHPHVLISGVKPPVPGDRPGR